MNLNSLLINTTAAIFLLYGLGFIIQPLELSVLVSGEAPVSGSAIADMRATYGGMSAAVGILLFVLGSKPEFTRLGLLTVLLFMLGMAVGRSVGLLVDSPVNSVMYIYLALELLAVVAAVSLLVRSLRNGD